MPLLEFRLKGFLLFVTVAPPAVHSLSNGRTPSSSSEEDEQGTMKNTDSSSSKSEDVKSEVGENKYLLLHEHDSEYYFTFSYLAIIWSITGFDKQLFLPSNIHFISPEQSPGLQVVRLQFDNWWLHYHLVAFYWDHCVFIYSGQNRRLYQIAWMI